MRKELNGQLNRTKHIVYLCVGLGMLVFAVPQLIVGLGATMPTLFSVVWIGFALLSIAANLHFILGVDEETRNELRRLKRARAIQLERLLLGRAK